MRLDLRRTPLEGVEDLRVEIEIQLDVVSDVDALDADVEAVVLWLDVEAHAHKLHDREVHKKLTDGMGNQMSDVEV